MQEFSPLQYMQIDVANLMGLDKKLWTERLSWFKEHEHELLDLTSEADAPCQYYAAVQAYKAAIEGKINHHPIILDATSSGTQILSVLIGDSKAAKLCNVINTGNRADLYTYIYHKFLTKLHSSNMELTRDMVKKAIMTSLYGSKASPKSLFGENVDIFYQVMAEECPDIWELNNFLVDAWNPEISSYGWVMPDNFHVNIKVYNDQTEYFTFLGEEFSFNHKIHAPCEYGRAYSANVAHSIDSLIVREITAMAMYNPMQLFKIKALLAGERHSWLITTKKNLTMVDKLVHLYNESGFLSARILDYIDKESIKLIPEDELKALLDALPAKPFQVACIHDSFHVLPNYGNDIRRLYILQLTKIAKSNLLQFILRQLLNDTNLTVEKTDEQMYLKVANAEYALS